MVVLFITIGIRFVVLFINNIEVYRSFTGKALLKQNIKMGGNSGIVPRDREGNRLIVWHSRMGGGDLFSCDPRRSNQCSIEE